MSIVGVQLIIFVFSFFMLYNVYLYWKKGEVGLKGASAWIIIWGGLLFITFFPKFIEPLVKELFFVRLFDLTTVGALVILAYVMFENHVRINRLQRQMSQLVSQLAIKRVTKN
ncbi:MAG: DUF2304 domain-containing protein [Candidatus Shapirobacteria bacterium]